ncbi:MAG: M28 family peptidase [Bryobacterales bacterium]|nr:M28 family peptidase [Bryobacterales bacterium]
MLRRSALTLLSAFLVLPALPAKRHEHRPSPQSYIEHVKYLSSDEMRGRATASPELEKAARYIARQFKTAGLQPLQGKDYLLPFPVTTNAELGKQNRLEWRMGDRSGRLDFEREFIPFNFSSSGRVEGEVVFAGYGITAREYNYDDYAGLDVKGKIVLLLRHEPQEFDEKSVFSGRIYTEHSQFFSKAANAKSRGAAGVVLINDRPNHRGEADDLEKFGKTVGPANAGLPFVQMKAGTAEDWLAAIGKNLDEVHTAIDRDLAPQSFAIPGLRIAMQVDVARAMKTTHNVAGYLPGTTNEYIVIGAHYDHLGLGEQFSMAPAMAGTPHPGADDNASGTAGVIELARRMASEPKRQRGVLFLAFAGEELGLLGSSHYVNNPKLAMQTCVAMINMDMIGRIREGKVYIGGAGSGEGFKDLLARITPRYPLNVDLSDTTGYGSSDHTSFTTKEVPVLFFFSGLHADYHKPSDTWEKIDAEGAIRLLDLVADVASELRDGGDRPKFVRVTPPAHGHTSAGSATGSSTGSGYGAYFGSIPDFGEVPNGVKFADVREGSPAAVAGLRKGDILTEFNGKPIANLYDFTYALRSHQPGEEVPVKVLRGDDTVEVVVVLGKR